MKGLPEDPTRLRDSCDRPNLVERIAGHAARDLSQPEQLSSFAMAKIAARIDADRPTRSGSLRLGWVLVVGSFLLGIATAASAAHLDLVPRWVTRIMRGELASTSRTSAPTVAKVRPLVRREPPAPSTSTINETGELPAARGPAEQVLRQEHIAGPLGRRQGSAGEPAQPTPTKSRPPEEQHLGVVPHKPPSLAMVSDHAAAPSATVSEQQPPFVAWPPSASAPLVLSDEPRQGTSLPLHEPSAFAKQSAATAPPASPSQAPPRPSAKYLKEIVRALRLEHSPQRALSLLDRHASELSGDAFAEESLLLRVEAMLALGQREAVLRLLDGRSLTNLSASRGLLVTRGELRAASNRCAEGIGDFELALAGTGRPNKQALLGRALCKQKLGDTASAKADFDRYRREFPNDPLPQPDSAQSSR